MDFPTGFLAHIIYVKIDSRRGKVDIVDEMGPSSRYITILEVYHAEPSYTTSLKLGRVWGKIWDPSEYVQNSWHRKVYPLKCDMIGFDLSAVTV